jgi:hypothetical protein
MNSSTGPLLTQSKAPAAICMVLLPRTAGEVLKVKEILVLLFNSVTEVAGVPFKVKSLASRVAGSTGSFTSRRKSVGGCG